MKKIFLIITTLFLVLSLTACNKKEFKVGKFQGVAKGFYGGDMVVEVTTNKDGGIDDIAVVEHKEEGLGENVIKVMPKRVLDAQSLDVEVVTGATITSKAFLDATKDALAKAGIDASKMVKKETAKAEVQELSADVVVVGAGGAGLTAAIEAASAGKTVIVVEKASTTGGNSIRATGGMNAAKTTLQDTNEFSETDAVVAKLNLAKEKYPALNDLIATVEKQLEDYQANPSGYFDSKELFVLDTLVGGGNQNDPLLVDTLVSNSPAAIDWLKSIGIDLSSVGQFGGASVKRIHRPVNEEGKTVAVGSYMLPILEKVATEKGVQIIFEAPATKLIVENDMVVGVETASHKINAKAVVLATGGFAANLDMVAELNPELKGFVTTNAPGITGDGIEMAKAVGAAVVDMNSIQIHPTVEQKSSGLVTEGLRGDGAILVNSEGRRFIDEVNKRDVVSKAEIEQPGGFAYLIVDSKMVEKSNVIKGYIKKGYTVSGESVEDLAKNIEVDANNLVETLDKWNQAVTNKEDVEFGRKNFADTLDTAPYYAIKVSPGVHHTMGGLKINDHAEVLKEDGSVIKGLFAAGEITGGVHGNNRLGGNAVADIVVFGRIAGTSAANYAK